MSTPVDFRPTHVVPPGGLAAWESPDTGRPTVPLDALLPVQLIDRRGDWARILCANAWSAWVDGRLLVTVPQGPPVPGAPLARTADPRPLLTRVQDMLSRYRSAAEDLAAGRLDGETFRQRTQGLRAGMVVDGEAVWLYDAEHERWVYCDGTRLSTFAASGQPSGTRASAAPSADDGPPPAESPGAGPSDATRVVAPSSDGQYPEGIDGARAWPGDT
ncbi:hypothetical protein [Streptomyces sp. ERV7]|uniref:hypothetical protein n=1 Tax=Streptomyces sp. ERV7 TaxID=1322334 RepID=UPI000A6EBE6A|nr:hypothetical protein [Streptomyces sp. ERV7]